MALNLQQLTALERQNGLPTGLLSAVMQQESGGNPDAISPAGAQGAFQFMPATAKEYGINPFNPEQSAQAAAKLFSSLSQKYQGDVPSMLAGYNWGQGNVDRKGLQNAPAETRNYISKIQPQLGKQYADAGNIMNDASVEIPPLPEGFTLDAATNNEIPPLPEGFTLDGESPQPQGNITKSTLQQADLASRLQSDFLKRKQQFSNIGQNNESGAERALQGVGTYIGGLGDVAGNLIGSGARLAHHLVPATVDNAVSDVATNLMNTEQGQNFKRGASYLAGRGQELANQYPRAAADLGALGNIASVAPVGKIAGIAGDLAGGAISNAGKVIEAGADARTLARKTKFAQDLVMPDLTANQSVKAGEVGRTTKQGLSGKYVVKPNPQEATAISHVAEVPGVKPNNTYLENYQAINQAKNQEAENLLTHLKKNDVAISDDALINGLATVRDNLGKNMFLTGNGGKAAESTVNAALDIIQKHPQTASGLLQARKEFDNFVLSQKPKVFDAVAEAPVNAAVKEVRQTINNIVDQAVPDAGVKASLAKQSSFYNALDNIAPKVAKENPTRLGRAAERITDKLPGESVAVKTLVGTAAAAGLGGAAISGALPGLAGAAALYGVGKAALSPTTQKVIGSLVRGTGEALKTKAKFTKKDLEKAFEEIKKVNPRATKEIKDTYNGQK